MTLASPTRRRLQPTVLAACLLLAGAAAAQDEEENGEPTAAEMQRQADAWELPEPDTERWGCGNCPFPEGWNGYVELGAGNVSDDSFEFGDYRGLEEEGAFPVAAADVRYRGDEAGYLEFRGDELGIDSRSARVEGGVQGSFGLWLEYDQLPHFVSDETRTVFRGTGSSNLTLPGGWVRAGSTGGMTALDASLRDIDIEQERESVGVGADLLAGDRWRFSVEAREDTKEGNRVQGGSFLFNSALLPAPVDYETERLDASVAYVRSRWQIELGFHTSTFTNENEALIWANPFASANNADQGRLALPPDNQFNQVSLAGSWRSQDSLTVAGRLALGRMEQDEDFLPPTINGSLAAPTNPRNDLDGEVDTRALDLRVTGEPLQRLSAKGELYYHERDNSTPRDDYVQVATDELVTSARTNRPYSYERSGVEGALDYRVSSRFTLSGEVGRDEFDRTLQEAEETTTDTVALEVRGMLTDSVHLRLRRLREERDGSYEQLGLTPMENPELRKFNMAERERLATRLGLDYMASETLSVGLAAEIADDDYTESDIGLSDARDRSVSLDVSFLPAENVTAYVFASLQAVDADIRGADNINGADWLANQNDDYRTIGLGVELADLPGNWTVGGLDLTYATGDTEITIDKVGSGTSDFPEIETRLYTLDLHADRSLGKSSTLRLGYLVEGFREEDFQRDGVDPDTIPTVLTLGEGTPGYTVHVIQASLRYRF